MKTTIIIVGGSHRDPAPQALIRQSMWQLQQVGIRTTFCEELPLSKSLTERTENDLNNVAFFSKLLKDPDIEKLIHKNNSLHYPYFHSGQQADVTERLMHRMPERTFEYISACARLLLNINAIRESAKIGKFCSQSSIPYVPIDLDYEDRSFYNSINLSKAGVDTKTCIFPREDERQHCMAETILKKALPTLSEEGGVIFCSVGVLHCQRLGAELNYRLNNDDNYFKYREEVNVITTFTYSKYIQDGIPTYEEFIANLPANIPERLKSALNQTRFELIEAKEKLASGQPIYSSDAFFALGNQAGRNIAHVKFYSIPNWNVFKQDLVSQLSGKVISIEGDNATVEIDTTHMKKPIREQLEVARFRIFLDQLNQPTLSEIIKIPDLTIELEEKANTLILTLPLSQKQQLTKLIKNPIQYQEEVTLAQKPKRQIIPFDRQKYPFAGYLIQDWDLKKQELVKQIGGSVVKNHGIGIITNLPIAQLKKVVCQQLGITRLRVYINRIEPKQYEQLCVIDGSTFEEGSLPNTIIITVPTAKVSIINEILSSSEQKLKINLT